MWNINRTYIFKNVYSNLYISEQLEPTEDNNHNKIATYGVPIKYNHWNIQSLKTQSELLEFGQNAPNMKVATIPNTPKYANKFKAFDLAYLDGNIPNGEVINGQNANYRIYSVRPQNSIIKIYFSKLTK